MFKNVLAIGAHPDDVEFSCLGFLMKLKELDANINIFIASLGSKGDQTSGELRISESKAALNLLNPTINIRNKMGIETNDFEEISNELRFLIMNLKPDLILIHSQHDTHQEHKLLREILLSAARRVRCTILSYKSVSVTSSYEENFFVDISDFIDKKIFQLQLHKSQLKHDYFSKSSILSYHANWFGKQRECDFVESYHVEQILL
jgi:LmbE family N-acetylglucosaminyl deacetylase